MNFNDRMNEPNQRTQPTNELQPMITQPTVHWMITGSKAQPMLIRHQPRRSAAVRWSPAAAAAALPRRDAPSDAEIMVDFMVMIHG